VWENGIAYHNIWNLQEASELRTKVECGFKFAGRAAVVEAWRWLTSAQCRAVQTKESRLSVNLPSTLSQRLSQSFLSSVQCSAATSR
jgi:hypothetical protein